jgi:putative tricarboxylic transport membrane protein
MMEEYLRRALTLSRGDPMIFLARPISAAALIAALLALGTLVLPSVRATCSKAFAE